MAGKPELRLPLCCSNCGKDVSDGVRGRDWVEYDLMVACAACVHASLEPSDAS